MVLLKQVQGVCLCHVQGVSCATRAVRCARAGQELVQDAPCVCVATRGVACVCVLQQEVWHLHLVCVLQQEVWHVHKALHQALLKVCDVQQALREVLHLQQAFLCC